MEIKKSFEHGAPFLRRHDSTISFTRFRVVLTRGKLAKIRARALRKGVWFRVLKRAERAQIELTIRTVKRVRSLLLTKVLACLVMKLSNALESKVERLTREVGKHLARTICLIAQSWGHVSAFMWEAEHSFVQYLSVMYMNTPEMYKMYKVQGET